MYGDKQQGTAPADAADVLPLAAEQDQSALFSAAESGEGQSPNSRLKDEENAICEAVARRLVRARKAAGYKELDVALHLGHSNLTMISLFENGHRPPSLRNLSLLADLYGVTIDYLMGRTDDLDLAPEEGNQALLTGQLKGSLTSHIDKFLGAIARCSAVTLEGLSKDRVMLDQIAFMAAEARSALDVIQKHHGKAFDGLRGGATLKRLVEEMELTLEARAMRKQHERALAEYEHPIRNVREIEEAVQQALLF